MPHSRYEADPQALDVGTQRQVHRSREWCGEQDPIPMVLTLVRDAVGHGVECPTCQTLYLLQGALNQHGMYCHFPAKGEKSRWTLLCICSEQFSFEKEDIQRYSVPRGALERGYALECEWKTSGFGTLPEFPKDVFAN